jgi:hypothetical protein
MGSGWPGIRPLMPGAWPLLLNREVEAICIRGQEMSVQHKIKITTADNAAYFDGKLHVNPTLGHVFKWRHIRDQRDDGANGLTGTAVFNGVWLELHRGSRSNEWTITGGAKRARTA